MLRLPQSAVSLTTGTTSNGNQPPRSMVSTRSRFRSFRRRAAMNARSRTARSIKSSWRRTKASSYGASRCTVTTWSITTTSRALSLSSEHQRPSTSASNNRTRTVYLRSTRRISAWRARSLVCTRIRNSWMTCCLVYTRRAITAFRSWLYRSTPTTPLLGTRWRLSSQPHPALVTRMIWSG